MESARLSIKEGTHCVAYISVSIIPFTRRGVKKKKIPVAHWAIPWSIWKAMEEEKEAEASGHMTKKQQQLDFQTVMGPREFTREGVLHAVAKLIATNDQVSH